MKLFYIEEDMYFKALKSHRQVKLKAYVHFRLSTQTGIKRPLHTISIHRGDGRYQTMNIPKDTYLKITKIMKEVK